MKKLKKFAFSGRLLMAAIAPITVATVVTTPIVTQAADRYRVENIWYQDNDWQGALDYYKNIHNSDGYELMLYINDPDRDLLTIYYKQKGTHIRVKGVKYTTDWIRAYLDYADYFDNEGYTYLFCIDDPINKYLTIYYANK